MKHKKQKWYFLHPGDLKRYRKEEDFKWEDIRKIAYYPEEMAKQAKEEKLFKQKRKEPEIEIPKKDLEMSEEELKKMIDEYLTDDRLFEIVKESVNEGKLQRIVINLPGWLKVQLKEKSKKKGLSMNAIMRLALTEYLARN